MGLRAVLAQATAAAYRAIGDIPESVTLRHYTGAYVRNATTGYYTRPLTDYACDVVFVDAREQAGQWSIEFGDRIGLFRLAQLGAGVETGDLVLRGAECWEVLNTAVDPAGATCEAHLRLKKQVVNAGPPGPPSVGQSIVPFTPYEFEFGIVNPSLVYTIPALTLVIGARLTIRVPFNGTAPQISVGTPGLPERLMAVADNAPGTLGDYEVPVDLDLPAGTQINIYVTPGFGATQGGGVLTLDLLTQ